MRAIALHEDVLVLTSRLWQTNATALRAGGECMLVDAPYFPDELEMLPGVLAQAGFRPDALLATHADYDHLLARLPFPDLPLGVGETTMERIRAQPGEAQRDLREEDARNYVTRDRPLGLGGVRSLPVPGKLELGSGGEELELHPAEGHTADGTAVFMPSAAVLVCGDYLSDVEIPHDRRGGLAGGLPAHAGAPGAAGGARGVRGAGPRLAADPRRSAGAAGGRPAYLDALEAGRDELPPGPRHLRQREIHADNVAKHVG